MILGFIEHDGGRVSGESLEMLTLARALAEQTGLPLEAAAIGSDAREAAGVLAAYGARRLHLIEEERLAVYAPEAWAESLVQLLGAAGPEALLAPGTERGNEVMAHVAARSGLPLAVNCVAVQAGEPYAVTRLRWGGSLLEEAHLDGRPRLLTVAPHAVAPAGAETPAGAGEMEIRSMRPALEERAFRVRVTSRLETAGDKVSLADARLVVGGGRGVGSSEGFAPLEELAELLGGAVGASRAVTSHGWRSHVDQIGQTGTRIAPDLYIACGISGAIQHMVGCAGARQILAINTDAEAPIIAKADYAVIGDLHQVVPAIVEEIKKARGSR